MTLSRGLNERVARTGGHSLVINREPLRANKQGSDLIRFMFLKEILSDYVKIY